MVKAFGPACGMVFHCGKLATARMTSATAVRMVMQTAPVQALPNCCVKAAAGAKTCSELLIDLRNLRLLPCQQRGECLPFERLFAVQVKAEHALGFGKQVTGREQA